METAFVLLGDLLLATTTTNLSTSQEVYLPFWIYSAVQGALLFFFSVFLSS